MEGTGICIIMLIQLSNKIQLDQNKKNSFFYIILFQLYLKVTNE